MKSRRSPRFDFLTNPTGDSKLELLPIDAGEEEGHVSVYNEPVVVVPDFLMPIPDAPRHPLPRHIPPVSASLQAVAEILASLSSPMNLKNAMYTGDIPNKNASKWKQK